MEEFRLLREHLFLIAILGFFFSACSQTAISPDLEMAAGVYVHSGFEFYRWKEGFALMIWHDGTKSSFCTSSTNGQNHVMNYHVISKDNHIFDWQ